MNVSADARGARWTKPHGGRRESWPFAARQAELEAALSFLSDPDAESILFHGGPGAGKSRLALEFAGRVEARGRRVERLTVTPSSAVMPLGAFSALLSSQMAGVKPVQAFREAARILASEGDESQRTVLVIDDLHLLDDTSSMLLGHLLHTRTVFLVATVRDQAPYSDALESIDRREGTRRLAVRSFSAEDVAALLKAAVGAPAERATVDALNRASGGNALFLRELVEAARRTDGSEHSHGLWRLTGSLESTDRLTELLERRLRTVPEEQYRVLETVALCEPLELSAVCRSDDGDLGIGSAHVEALEQAGLLRIEAEGTRMTCVLGHPLYGELVSADITEARRIEIYRRQVEVMSRHGGRRQRDALKLATWQIGAGLPVEPDTLMTAAALARHAHDWEGLLRLLEASPENGSSFEVWMLKGEAHHHRCRWQEAEECFALAQDLAPDEEGLVNAVMARTQNAFWGVGDYEQVQALHRRADHRLSAVGREALRIDEAAFRIYRGEVGSALQLLEGVSRIPFERIRIWAELQRSLALSYSGRTQEAVRLSTSVQERVEEHARQHGLEGVSNHTTSPAIYRLVALVDAGDLSNARSVGEAAFRDALADQVVPTQAWLSAHLGRCELLAGRLEQARAWFAESCALSRAHDYPSSAPFAHAGLALVEAQQGAIEEATRSLAVAEPRSDRQFAVQVTVRMAQAWCAAAGGDLEKAQAVLLQAAAQSARAGMHSYEAWALAELSRLGGAAAAADRLAALAEASDSATVHIWALHAQAASRGDYARLGQVTDACVEAGLHLLAAESAHATARGTTDPRTAAAWRLTAQQALERCGQVDTPALRGLRVRSLTRREAEIAELACEDLTSQDIASRLVLSVRTVENHLQHAYEKLGITSRRELAGALAGIWCPADRREGRNG
ncbi:LuxR C-terminal-related transcriptional regulator [Streptomyces sp. NPDC087908]|uniref:LuxR C-terminal-related transcriptional regulator n=1 Tax=Streptomyces sp. NPDC087908 TaxID=3365820 RepID=UPI0037FC69ED